MNFLNQLWSHISKRRKKQFWLLFVLMIITSLAEVVSIGAVIPFLGALTSPDTVFNYHLMKPIIELLKLTEPEQLLFPMTVGFISVVLISGGIRILLLFTMTRFSYITGADLSIDIYRRTLYQNYSVHISRNSSEVINGIIKKTDLVIGGVFVPFLTLMSSFIILIGIVTILFVVNFLVAFITLFGFGILYWGVIRNSRKNIALNSKTIARESNQMIKVLQEGLGGIRDVLIDGSQQFYCKLYRDADYPYRRAAGNNQFIAASPKFAMEALGMSLIALLAYFMIQKEGTFSSAIPLLGVLALGAQRMLPTLQQGYAAYSTIKGSHASLEDVIELLNQPIPIEALNNNIKPILFEKEIIVNKLSFSYTNKDPHVLANINLRLAKGSKIGFVGKTGSGKSTLIDILMGLLPPSDGTFSVDDLEITADNYRAWQSHIAHVPQNIFLTDNSIESNIAFGVPKEQIDHKQVVEAAIKAQIDGVINDLPDKYQTHIGEQGIRLSGGQRQRLGIARALYKKADVLVFDEATSALDSDTENLVMKAIESLGDNITILIIAHRVSTLKNCDKVVELVDKNNFRVGEFNEIFPDYKK
jgi:ATP-binding cassette, subfamily B, bacterial PglK